MSSKKDKILNAKELPLDLDEPASDELENEEEFSTEDLAITAENVDAFADDSVRLYLREIGKIPLLTPPKLLKHLQENHPQCFRFSRNRASNHHKNDCSLWRL